MHTKRILAALALAAVGLTWRPAAPAGAATPDSRPGPSWATTQESDCFEVLTQRGVKTTEVDLLVPERFGLPATATTTLFLHTYTCRQFSVDGQPQVGRDKTTTITIGSVSVTSVDGQPTTGFTGYVLWYGTDNPVLFAKFHQLGWPVTFLPATTAVLPQSPQAGDAVTAGWAIRGPGIDYDLQVNALEPTTSSASSTVPFLHEGSDGRLLRLAVANQQAGQVSATSTTAQLEGIDLLQPLLTDPRFNTIPQPGQVARFPYLRGSWASQLTVEEDS